MLYIGSGLDWGSIRLFLVETGFILNYSLSLGEVAQSVGVALENIYLRQVFLHMMQLRSGIGHAPSRLRFP